MSVVVARALPRSTIVTGGSGRIGQYVLEHLSTTRCVENFDLVPLDGHPYRDVDVMDLNSLRASISAGADIAHFAALDFDVKRPESDFIRINVTGTWNVLQAAEEAGVRRVVVCSSVAATGLHERDGNHPHTLPVDETIPCRPRDAYGASKAAVEVICRTFAERGILEITVLRPCAVVFPGTTQSFINSVYDRPTYLDYVTVGDVARAVELALDTTESCVEPIFLTADDCSSVEPTLEWFSRAFGSLPEFVDSDRYAQDPQASIFSNRRAREKLGWVATSRFSTLLNKCSSERTL
jgi:UDP-glucose 4-epimerase